MTTPDYAGVRAAIEEAAADTRQKMRTIEQESIASAARGTAQASAAMARFRRLATRLRQDAQERAEQATQPELSYDDPVAELEHHAADLDDTPPDPAEPTEQDLDDFRAMVRIPEPEMAADEQNNTSLAQWSNTRTTTWTDEDYEADEDFADPW